MMLTDIHGVIAGPGADQGDERRAFEAKFPIAAPQPSQGIDYHAPERIKAWENAAPPQPVSYFHCNGEFHAVMPADWEPSESGEVSKLVTELRHLRAS